MDIAWRLAPGPAAQFAAPQVEGAERVDTRFLQRYAAGRLENEPYSPDRLERARRSVLALGPFASVRARAADRLDGTGRLPTTFSVAERARHAVGLSAAYETNYGPSVRAYWEHRNLLGGAERLRVEAELARIGTGGSIGEMTYRGGVTYRDPGLFGRELTLVVSLFALRERLEAYDRDAITGTVLFEQRLSERLNVFAGPTVDFGRSGPPDGDLSPYQIAGLTFGGRYDGTDSLLDPSQGWRANGAVTPVLELFHERPLRAPARHRQHLLGRARQPPQHPRRARHDRLAAGRPTVRRAPAHALLWRRRRLRPRLRLPVDRPARRAQPALRRRQPGGSQPRMAAAGLGRHRRGRLRRRRQRRFAVPRRNSPTCVSAPASASATTRRSGPSAPTSRVPLVKQQNSSSFGLYVGIGQAF